MPQDLLRLKVTGTQHLSFEFILFPRLYFDSAAVSSSEISQRNEVITQEKLKIFLQLSQSEIDLKAMKSEKMNLESIVESEKRNSRQFRLEKLTAERVAAEASALNAKLEVSF